MYTLKASTSSTNLHIVDINEVHLLWYEFHKRLILVTVMLRCRELARMVIRMGKNCCLEIYANM